MDLARHTIREQLDLPSSTPIADDPALDTLLAGCFVSLHELGNHRLRGCIGRIDAALPLRQSVEHAARGVLCDPRFKTQPVTARDLTSLDIEISVLSPPSRVASPHDFDLLNDGVFLTIDGRRGCFLPQVARSTGWTREQLLDRLCTEKLGLSVRSWQRPDAAFQKFSVTLIGPVPFVENPRRE